jgi:hypothetical protein
VLDSGESYRSEVGRTSIVFQNQTDRACSVDTLFASGDSRTKAQLVAATETGLRLGNSHVRDPIAYHARLIENVFAEAAQFDILHFHLDYLHPSPRQTPRIPRCKQPITKNFGVAHCTFRVRGINLLIYQTI